MDLLLSEARFKAVPVSSWNRESASRISFYFSGFSCAYNVTASLKIFSASSRFMGITSWDFEKCNGGYISSKIRRKIYLQIAISDSRCMIISAV